MERGRESASVFDTKEEWVLESFFAFNPFQKYILHFLPLHFTLLLYIVSSLHSFLKERNGKDRREEP